MFYEHIFVLGQINGVVCSKRSAILRNYGHLWRPEMWVEIKVF